MGLDMYVIEIYRPTLEQAKYTTEQLHDSGYSYMTVERFNECGAAMSEIRRFCVKALVAQEYYDMEKIKADYDLPDNARIGMWSAAGISISGKRGDVLVHRDISQEEIDAKYTLIKDEECYVWGAAEVAYWRKAYDKQFAWYEILDRDVENCGYYELTEDDIREFRERFPDDENSFECDEEDAALFYHEWY